MLPTKQVTSNKRTLLRAALMYKFFSKIALNVLWRCMIDPWLLLLLFLGVELVDSVLAVGASGWTLS
jgi:hypothetical protein